MLATSLALGLLALVLAWPVPVMLSRATWPERAPASALLLWQSIALAGGLSMIGALLAFGLIPFGNTIGSALTTLLHSLTRPPFQPEAEFFYLFALSGAVLLGGHLLLNLFLTIVLTQRQRQRHRQLVQLLSSPVPEQPNTRMIDDAAPVAYCLPGAPNSITVFSAGLIDLLDAGQLTAVIEHEKAHLLQRHDILIMAFDAWRTSLPWFPIATRAQRGVSTLVEMLADDRARRTVDDRVLASAIALVAEPSDASRGRDLEARVRRLDPRTQPLPLAGRLTAAVSAVALLAVPTILLFLPPLG